MTHTPEDSDPMDVRLSIVPAHGEESIALRLFDSLRGRLHLDNLGFSEPVRRAYGGLIERPGGLVLLSGPSSSGKTTTIYASLQYLMKGVRSGQKAVSLEDPIECPLDCVSQIEVDENRGLTFDHLFSKVLRQDVEVIMVGEIRDIATASIAHRAALTGHLILSTVHCGRAAEVPRRLVDLGLGPHEAAEAITGALVQRLVRVVCPSCRTEETVPDPLREKMRVPEWLKTAYMGAGCTNCMGTGYSGRTAVTEIMINTDEIGEMIRKNAPVSLIEQENRRLGIPDIKSDAFEKVAGGITSLAEVKRVLG